MFIKDKLIQEDTMKQKIIFAILFLSACLIFADNNSKFKNDRQLISYALGQQIGRNLKSQGVDVDSEIFTESLVDVLQNKKSKISDNKIRETLAKLVDNLASKHENKTVTRELSSDEYKWAFSQNMDGTFSKNEYCRESLAASIYLPLNKDKTTRVAGTHIYIFKGKIETYRIYGFKTQSECETALTNLVMRKK